MIISHQHKFIFIKTKKTASTSFEIALSKICGPQDVLTPISKKDEPARIAHASITAQNFYIPLHQYNRRKIIRFLAKKKSLPLRFYPHISCQEVKQFIPKKIWNEYYKFTIERNPFDKIVSLYYWREGDQKYGSLYDFIQKGGLRGFSSYDLYAINGLVAVDKVYQYENLSFLCEDLSQRLHLETPLAMTDYRAKSTQRSIKDYRDLFDERTIELVKLIFAREIKLLGYEY